MAKKGKKTSGRRLQYQQYRQIIWPRISMYIRLDVPAGSALQAQRLLKYALSPNWRPMSD